MSEGAEVVVFPQIAGVQWLDTVGSTLWEGGGRRSRPGYRPRSCEDCAGRRASPCRRRCRRRCMVLYIRRSGVQWALRTRVLHAPAVVVARDGPGPPGRSAGVDTRRSGGHVEVPDSSRGRSGTPSVCAERPSRKDT